MSEENVETVLQLIDAANRRDVDSLVALASPDVEWHDTGFWSEPAQVYRGRAELREWFNRVAIEPWESLHLEADEITEAADGRVFGGVVLTARGKASGVEAPAIRFWFVVWITNGKITRRLTFLDRAEALEAAGLRE
jgi:ketosteroid isomerase-like protein